MALNPKTWTLTQLCFDQCQQPYMASGVIRSMHVPNSRHYAVSKALLAFELWKFGAGCWWLWHYWDAVWVLLVMVTVDCMVCHTAAIASEGPSLSVAGGCQMHSTQPTAAE
jgi:hypothetical protein